MEIKWREKLVESYSQHLHLQPRVRQYHRRHAATECERTGALAGCQDREKFRILGCEGQYWGSGLASDQNNVRLTRSEARLELCDHLMTEL